jgi:RNA polymerase sigma factor (TIGR02999 family)
MSEPGPDASTTDTLFPLVYEELKRLARHQLRAGGGTGTLRTTDLVHEAFLKLAPGRTAAWEGRAHFFGAASRAMRQILVDFARRRGALKRGGGWRLVSLDQAGAALSVELDDLVALDAALEELDAASPRLRQLVELRFFGGLPAAEVAGMLGVTTRTVERDWLKARLFLLDRMDGR